MKEIRETIQKDQLGPKNYFFLSYQVDYQSYCIIKYPPNPTRLLLVFICSIRREMEEQRCHTPAHVGPQYHRSSSQCNDCWNCFLTTKSSCPALHYEARQTLAFSTKKRGIIFFLLKFLHIWLKTSLHERNFCIKN